MRVIDDKYLHLIKSSLFVNNKVISKDGIATIININEDGIIAIDNNNEKKQYSFYDVIPILKGFKHLNYKEIYSIADIIVNNNEFNTFKLNFNFLPHFYEVTDESKDIKIQIYHNFDIVYCDNLISNLGKAYFYLSSNGYDIYNLNTIGLAIINSKVYA
jgi:hypothetical protein